MTRWLEWLRFVFSDTPPLYDASRGRWADGSFRPVLWEDGESVRTMLRQLRLRQVKR